MLGKSITKLIIVCDDKTEEYANNLRQLVSMNDDKDGEIVGTEDGTVEVAVWLEKDYIANSATISSKEHVLFIGENKTSKKEISSMNVKFDKFGMKYGWLGKRGMMIVADNIKRPETYDKFIEFCLGYQKEFEKVVLKNSGLEKAAGATAAGAVAAGAVAAGAGAAILASGGLLAFLAPAALSAVGSVGVTKSVTMMSEQKIIKDQQYRALTTILYMDALKEFLEG